MTEDSNGQAFSRLCDIMSRLLGPGGCPWDAAQTSTSLKPYIIEEAYELIDAIDSENKDKICEELGDLLLQVVFQAQLHARTGAFNPADVANGIADKLVRRHPHVFADAGNQDKERLHRQWEEIKQSERRQRGESSHLFSGVPRSLPALQRAQLMLEKTARAGHCLPDEDPLETLRDICHELATSTRQNATDTLLPSVGRALFAMVEIARAAGVDAEDELRKSCDRYGKRVLEHISKDKRKIKPESEST